jgi:hypothetical protein
MEKNYFFLTRKESDPELEPEPDPDLLVRRPDSRIRIRTNMSRIPHTDKDIKK